MPTPYEGNPDSKHLYIYLTDPNPDSGEVLIVSISSVKTDRYWDNACKLSPGCHSFIVKDSFVVYRSCKIADAAVIERKIKSGEIIPKEDMSSEEFAYILKGLETSKFTAPKYLKFFQDNS